jgi:hypothetical protein
MDKFEIVCVDATTTGRCIASKLEKGRIYTIRSFHEWKGQLRLRLEEIVGSPRVEAANGGYKPQRFRPCRKTDISELAKLVAPSLREKEKTL